MENPVQEIAQVIHLLCQTPPSFQQAAIQKYFVPDAAFYHPFCRTDRFDGSRFLIQGIYRWYKILSPKIKIHVNSAAFDESNSLLYVNITQVFAIWFIPFYSSRVTLTTLLKLQHDKSRGKYYIAEQNDLYQTDQFIRFVLPVIGFPILWAWQMFATFLCLALSFLFWPITAYEEYLSPHHAGDQQAIADAIDEVAQHTKTPASTLPDSKLLNGVPSYAEVAKEPPS